MRSVRKPIKGTLQFCSMGIDGDSRAGDYSLSSGNSEAGTSQQANALSQDEETHPQNVDGEIKAKDVSVEAERRVNAIKPWKEKKKAAQKNRVAKDEIEIFEGKGVMGPSPLEITSPDKGYLKIVCKGDREFVVPRKVVECFQCVDITLHSDGQNLSSLFVWTVN